VTKILYIVVVILKYFLQYTEMFHMPGNIGKNDENSFVHKMGSMCPPL